MSAMVSWILWGLFGFGALGGVLAVWFVLLLCWVARGESDINGEKERDAMGE